MPPRLAVFAILLFWTATTVWLFYREVLPEWLADTDEPPVFKPDIIVELGASTTRWQLFLNGKDAGIAISSVSPQKDRTFLFDSTMTFTGEKKLLGLISKIKSTNHVSLDGKLLDLSVDASISPDNELFKKLLKAHLGVESMKVVTRARIEDAKLKPRLAILDANGREMWSMEPAAIPVSNNGSVLNPAQMGDKITGLWPGKSWRIPMVNPLADPLSLKQDAAQQVANVIATVSAGTIDWANNKDVPCLRIDFTPPPDVAMASSLESATWVRRSDGLVLKQKINMKTLNLDLELLRIEEKNP